MASVGIERIDRLEANPIFGRNEKPALVTIASGMTAPTAKAVASASSDAQATGGWLASCLLQSVARNVQFHNDAVVYEAVTRGRRRHRVLEDSLPFGERQVTGQ